MAVSSGKHVSGRISPQCSFRDSSVCSKDYLLRLNFFSCYYYKRLVNIYVLGYFPLIYVVFVLIRVTDRIIFLIIDFKYFGLECN